MPVKNNLTAKVKSYMRAIPQLRALGNWKSNEKNRSTLDPFFEKLSLRIGPERAD